MEDVAACRCGQAGAGPRYAGAGTCRDERHDVDFSQWANLAKRFAPVPPPCGCVQSRSVRSRMCRIAATTVADCGLYTAPLMPFGARLRHGLAIGVAVLALTRHGARAGRRRRPVFRPVRLGGGAGDAHADAARSGVGHGGAPAADCGARGVDRAGPGGDADRPCCSWYTGFDDGHRRRGGALLLGALALRSARGSVTRDRRATAGPEGTEEAGASLAGATEARHVVLVSGERRRGNDLRAGRAAQASASKVR